MDQCATDPRINWRGLTIRTDLNGDIVWYTMDNAKFTDSTTVHGTAAEYVQMRSDGKAMVITDETYGFGVITYECEAGVTCPEATTTTTTAATTTTATTTVTTTVTTTITTTVTTTTTTTGMLFT